MTTISDGPAKSFAFRRLRYLDSSWQMYILLNEFQEMADSKVSIIVFFILKKGEETEKQRKKIYTKMII